MTTHHFSIKRTWTVTQLDCKDLYKLIKPLTVKSGKWAIFEKRNEQLYLNLIAGFCMSSSLDNSSRGINGLFIGCEFDWK